MRRILLIFMVIVILLVGIGMGYFHYSKPGILLMHGLSRDKIKLTLSNDNLQFYLYEKKQEIGFLVLRKRDHGYGWKIYSDTSKRIDDNQFSIKTLYPTIQNGTVVVKGVWGGGVKGASSSEITLKINGGIYPPDLMIFKKNDYLYFLVETDKVDKSDMLTIENR